MLNKDNPSPDTIYRCTVCLQRVERNDLLAKRVVYTTMGVPTRTIRSRTVAWVCSACREEDSAWTSEPHASSPGMAHTKLAQDG